MAGVDDDMDTGMAVDLDGPNGVGEPKTELGMLIHSAMQLESANTAAMARICSAVSDSGCPTLLTLVKQQAPDLPEDQKALLRAKMEVLLLLGANVNGQDEDTGNTAAHLAVLQRDTQTLQLLQRFKVDLGRANRQKQRPFQCDDGTFRQSVQKALKLDEYEGTFIAEIGRVRNRLLDCSTQDLEKTVREVARDKFFRTAIASEGNDTKKTAKLHPLVSLPEK